MSFAPSLSKKPFVFFKGTKSSVNSIPFTVSLGGRNFAVDLRDYRRSSLVSLRDSVISTGQVDDALFNTDGAWWRYRHNWSYGAGQKVMDLGEDRDPRRFYESVGINPWNESELTLHRSTVQLTTSVSGQNIYLCNTSSHLYAADGSGLYRSSDLTSWTQITSISGTIKGITTDGTDVYVATSSNLYKVTAAATTASSLKAHAHDGVWFAGNRLITSEGHILRATALNGTETAIITHYQSSFVWTTVFAVGSKIYAGGTAGSRSEVYGFTINSSGDLVQGAEVVQLSPGELVQYALSHVGNVIFCTNKGVRLATVSQDGTLSYGPLIETPGSVQSAVAEGKYVWFNWKAIEGGKTGAGRLDLSATPRPLQPAYATDLYVDTTSECVAVARFDNRLILGIGGLGVYGENPTGYVTEGFIRSGNIHFGTVERKIVNDGLANFNALDESQQIVMEVRDHENTLLGSGSLAQENFDQIEIDLDGQDSDYFTVTIKILSDGDTTPVFKRWRLRSFPIVPPVEQFVVPILLYSKVVINDAQGQLQSQNVDEDMAFIENLWRRKAPISYVEGSKINRVRVEAYEFQPREWADNSYGFEGTLIVRLVTI